MIQLKDISVTFSAGTPLEKIALRNINLKVGEGDFVVVIGNNGAGKSTLMNILAGEMKPDCGTVFIDDKDVTAMNAAMRSRWVSRVFQDPLIGTWSHLTLEENLVLAEKRGQRRSLRFALNVNRRKHYEGLLENLGLGIEKRLKDPIACLSGGQRQAVSLLMATLRASKILLLDEHTAALDPRMVKKILALTETFIRKMHLTTLMITHSMHQALSFGDRMIVLKDGQIVCQLTQKERETIDVSYLLDIFEQ